MEPTVTRIAAREHRVATFRHFQVLVVVYVTVLLISNLVGQKMSALGPFRMSGAQLLFPLTYVFSDIFTEVYGYAASRRAIWLAFLANVLLAAMGLFMVWIPAAPEWPAENQAAFAIVFGAVPRMIVASLVAFWAGEFANSYVLARMKVWTGGRLLFARTIASTVVGQAIDSLLVTTVFFWGTVPFSTILVAAASGYAVKVTYEALATPLTYLVVNGLKRAEGLDVFDEGTDFNPFAREAAGGPPRD